MENRKAEYEYKLAIESCFEAGRMSWDELEDDEKLELWGWKVRSTKDKRDRNELLFEHDQDVDIPDLLATVALNDHRHATFEDWKEYKRTDLESLANVLLKCALSSSKKQISEDIELHKWDWYDGLREQNEIDTFNFRKAMRCKS